MEVAIEQHACENMAEEYKSTKVTIEIGPKENRLLNIIKKKTGNSLRNLCAEGIPFVILSYEDLLNDEIEEADTLSETISSSLQDVKKQVNSKR